MTPAARARYGPALEVRCPTCHVVAGEPCLVGAYDLARSGDYGPFDVGKDRACPHPRRCQQAADEAHGGKTALEKMVDGEQVDIFGDPEGAR